MAAIPHLVGILCGHVYHFFTVIHPLMGAKRRLGAPAWMKRRLDGGDNPNYMDTPGDGKQTPAKCKMLARPLSFAMQTKDTVVAAIPGNRCLRYYRVERCLKYASNFTAKMNP